MIFRHLTICLLKEVVRGLGLQMHAPIIMGVSFHVSENLSATLKVHVIPLDKDGPEAGTAGAVAHAQAPVARPAPRLALVNVAPQLSQRTEARRLRSAKKIDRRAADAHVPTTGSRLGVVCLTHRARRARHGCRQRLQNAEGLLLVGDGSAQLALHISEARPVVHRPSPQTMVTR